MFKIPKRFLPERYRKKVENINDLKNLISQNYTGDLYVSGEITLDGDLVIPNNVVLNFINNSLINLNGFNLEGTKNFIDANIWKQSFDISNGGHLTGDWKVFESSPQMFGALSGLHVDATREIQEATNLLTLSGGGTLYINKDYWIRPMVLEGVYGSQTYNTSLLTNELYPTRSVFNCVILEGDITIQGINDPTIYVNNEFIDTGGGSGTNDRFRGTAFWLSSGNFKFKDFNIDGEMPIYTDSLNPSDYCNANNTVNGQDCWDLTHKAINAQGGFNGVFDVIIEDVKFYNFAGEMIHGGYANQNGVNSPKNLTRWFLDKVYFYNCYGSAFSVGGYKKVNDSYFKHCGANGTEHADNNPYSYKDTYFEDCKNGMNTVGYIDVGGGEPNAQTTSSKVVDCTFYNCTYGISLSKQTTTDVQSLQGTLIQGNTFIDWKISAINTYFGGGWNHSILSNRFVIDRLDESATSIFAISSTAGEWNNCIIKNNVFERSRWAVSQDYKFGQVLSNMTNSLFENNTFNNANHTTYSDATSGLGSNNIIRNNTVIGEIHYPSRQSSITTVPVSNLSFTMPNTVFFDWEIYLNFTQADGGAVTKIENIIYPNDAPLGEGSEIKISINSSKDNIEFVVGYQAESNIVTDRPIVVSQSKTNPCYLLAKIVFINGAVHFKVIDDTNTWSYRNIYSKKAGITANRPDMDGVYDTLGEFFKGHKYYDTTLNQQLEWNGSAWVNI